MTSTTDVLDGVVEAVNGRGIKVGGDWRNISKFHPVELPARGARVRLSLDQKGFINTLDVLEAGSAAATSSSNRDRAIARMSALRSAAIFCGHKSTVIENVGTPEVLKIADSFLRWLEREEDPTAY